MIRHALLPALLALSTGSGCWDELVQIEARASEVCLTGVIVDVPGNAPSSVATSVIYEDPAAALPDGVDASAELTGVSISAVEGVQDFRFLRRVRVDVAAAELPAVTVADIGEDKSEMLAGADSWFVTAGADVELIDYLLSPELEIDLELQGEMPSSDWSVALDVCVAANVGYAADL